MNANFVVTGLLILIFCFGLSEKYRCWKMVSSRFDLPCNCWRRRSSDRNISMRPRMSSYGVSFTTNSHGNRSSLLLRDSPLPSLHWNRSEPGSILDTLSFVFPGDRSGEYWALHCIFCRCPNLISLRGIVSTILSRCTVSMDRDNGESAASFRKVSKKFGCKIAAPYQLLGRSEQTRDAARR
jgi:hypothetical protein